MKIRYIKREDIDKNKWDSCVHYATNGNVYGYTWYLDNVSENWDGLVEGDYESVFPLVWNDKFLGIKQIYQPFLAQQLGLYSVNMLSQKRIQYFIEAIPDEYKKIILHLNERNKIDKLAGFDINPRTNLTLNLNQDYDILEKNYSKNHKRSIKKAKKFKNVIGGNVKPEKLMEQYKKYQGSKIKGFKEEHYHAGHRIIYNALHRGRGFISTIQTKEGEPLASAFLTISHHRMVFLFSSTTPLGRERNSMHLLIDLLIQSNSGKHMTLDFEGSSVESIARFYKGFGATSKPYYQISKNNLPFWANLIKKIAR